jgi:hypothetical protein
LGDSKLTLWVMGGWLMVTYMYSTSESRTAADHFFIFSPGTNALLKTAVGVPHRLVNYRNSAFGSSFSRGF